MERQKNLTKFAWLSIIAALFTIALKSGAYVMTGSVSMLSDALESLINLVAAIFALFILKFASQPPDEEHMYGHGKAEYFSSGIEGALIVVAAMSIVYAAIGRLMHPQPIEQVGIGIAISIVATIINLVVGLILLRAGKNNDSIVLEADGKHLLADVWTTVGVVIAITLVSVTGWWRLDPIVAILVAVNILWSGSKLISRSVSGLLDAALPQDVVDEIIQTLNQFVNAHDLKYEELRTRQSGSQKFISFHLLVPGEWSVERAHYLTDLIEDKFEEEFAHSEVFIHVEPIEVQSQLATNSKDSV